MTLLPYRKSYPPKATGQKASPERRLAAFVVRRGRPVVQLDLGPVAAYARALNQWRGTVFVGNSNIAVTAPGVASTTSWTHLAMTKAGSTLTLYVNGAAVATTTVSGIVNTSTGILAIGRTGASSSDYFNGQIDEVAVYPTALSAARIAAHHTAGVTPPG